jgi:hypothetical protein
MIDVLKDIIEAAHQSGKPETAEALEETVRIASREMAVMMRDSISLN